MDKTPKERIVFDEGVYYGGEGSEISIEETSQAAKASPWKRFLIAIPRRSYLRTR